MATLVELLDRPLPLNRKERFYTGTVLPAIMCADNFAHLGRVSELLPTGPLEVRADPDDCTVVFFTEYSLTESLVGQSAKRFGDPPSRCCWRYTEGCESMPGPSLTITNPRGSLDGHGDGPGVGAGRGDRGVRAGSGGSVADAGDPVGGVGPLRVGLQGPGDQADTGTETDRPWWRPCCAGWRRRRSTTRPGGQ